jgi:hypothetical protein
MPLERNTQLQTDGMESGVRHFTQDGLQECWADLRMNVGNQWQLYDARVQCCMLVVHAVQLVHGSVVFCLQSRVLDQEQTWTHNIEYTEYCATSRVNFATAVSVCATAMGLTLKTRKRIQGYMEQRNVRHVLKVYMQPLTRCMSSRMI